MQVGHFDRGWTGIKAGEQKGGWGTPEECSGYPGHLEGGRQEHLYEGDTGCPCGTVMLECQPSRRLKWVPGQALPVSLPLDGQEEATSPAEDRSWSFVLTLRAATALDGTSRPAPVPGCRLWHAATWGGAPCSQDHLGRDAEQEVIIPPPHLQQQRGLRQDGLLQLARVHQRAPVDLDDDVAILNAPSLRR